MKNILARLCRSSATPVSPASTVPTPEVVYVEHVGWRGAWRITYSANGDGQNLQEAIVSPESLLDPFNKLGQEVERTERLYDSVLFYVGRRVRIEKDADGKCLVVDVVADGSPKPSSSERAQAPARPVRLELGYAVRKVTEIELQDWLWEKRVYIGLDGCDPQWFDIEGSPLPCLRCKPDDVESLKKLLLGKYVGHRFSGPMGREQGKLLCWSTADIYRRWQYGY